MSAKELAWIKFLSKRRVTCRARNRILPFTPYHFGPVLLIGMIVFPALNITALLISSVILDIEPFIVWMYGLRGPLHGISHTYLVATLAAVLVSVVVRMLRKPLNTLMSLFELSQDFSFRSLFFASIVGTYSHVLLDSFLYSEMNPFFPLMGNPFFGLVSLSIVYNLCLYSMILGFFVYVCRIGFFQRPRKTDESPWE